VSLGPKEDAAKELEEAKTKLHAKLRTNQMFGVCWALLMYGDVASAVEVCAYVIVLINMI
jgi:hypothetical protein